MRTHAKEGFKRKWGTLFLVLSTPLRLLGDPITPPFNDSLSVQERILSHVTGHLIEHFTARSTGFSFSIDTRAGTATPSGINSLLDAKIGFQGVLNEPLVIKLKDHLGPSALEDILPVITVGQGKTPIQFFFDINTGGYLRTQMADGTSYPLLISTSQPFQMKFYLSELLFTSSSLVENPKILHINGSALVKESIGTTAEDSTLTESQFSVQLFLNTETMEMDLATSLEGASQPQ